MFQYMLTILMRKAIKQQSLLPLSSILFQTILCISPAQAANFDVVQETTKNKAIMLVTGELEAGDQKRFIAKALDLDAAIVVLHSPGGSVLAGIEIGKAIRMKNFSTYVPKDMTCASACALAWLGGVKRFMSKESRIGFHAAYKFEEGKASESGMANALVGGYLNSLGLSQNAIAFVTEAGPNTMRWLNVRDASDVGIEVSIADFEPKVQENSIPNSGPSSDTPVSVPPPAIPSKQASPPPTVFPPLLPEQTQTKPKKRFLDLREAATKPPSEFLEAIMKCDMYFKPADVIKFLQEKKVIGKKAIFDGDGIPTFAVTKPISVFGLDVKLIEGWDETGKFFYRSIGTAPPRHIAVGFDKKYNPSIKPFLPAGMIKKYSGDYTENFLYDTSANYSDPSGTQYPSLSCSLGTIPQRD